MINCLSYQTNKDREIKVQRHQLYSYSTTDHHIKYVNYTLKQLREFCLLLFYCGIGC